MKKIFILLLVQLFVLSMPVICSNKKAPEKRPNILFVLADDQRANTINYLGNKEIITPNLDKLAAGGTSFTNAYIMGSYSGAVCQPSRAMLLTGKYLNNLYKSGAIIPKTDTLLGQSLQEAGYNCFGIGKYHNDAASFGRCFNGGQDIYFGGMYDQWNVPLHHYESICNFKKFNRPVIEDYRKSNVISYKQGDYSYSGKHSTDIFTDGTIDYINNYDSEKPFFIYTAFMTPHDPRSTHQKYIDMYDTAKISVPENFLPEHPFDNGELKVRDEKTASFPRKKHEIKEHIRDYYALITHNDDKLGALINALKENDLYDNTIIIYSGDNGLALGQHGLMGKQNLYEPSTNVPLILLGKGIKENAISDAMVYLTDVYPTICDMLGIKIPDSVDGSSFQKAIDKPKHKHRDYIVTSYRSFQRAIRNDQYKLIKYNVKGEKHTQLFDLIADPNETKDLSNDDQFKSVIKRLEDKMKSSLIEFNDTIWEN